jgi:hypothetical protein
MLGEPAGGGGADPVIGAGDDGGVVRQIEADPPSLR